MDAQSMMSMVKSKQLEHDKSGEIKKLVATPAVKRAPKCARNAAAQSASPTASTAGRYCFSWVRSASCHAALAVRRANAASASAKMTAKRRTEKSSGRRAMA